MTHHDECSERAHAYHDATLVIGRHEAFQYDLSYGLLPKLLELENPIPVVLPVTRLPTVA
jgi:hypothetical protein